MRVGRCESKTAYPLQRPFSVFQPCRSGKAKLGTESVRPGKRKIAKLDGKVELVVNPAMLADKMKIIRAQSVLSNTFTDVAWWIT